MSADEYGNETITHEHAGAQGGGPQPTTTMSREEFAKYGTHTAWEQANGGETLAHALAAGKVVLVDAPAALTDGAHVVTHSMLNDYRTYEALEAQYHMPLALAIRRGLIVVR